MPDRTSAWSLLTEFTQSESLRKHALAVEACMRAYARKFGVDEELWGTVGLRIRATRAPARRLNSGIIRRLPTAGPQRCRPDP